MPEPMVSCYDCGHYTLCERFMNTDSKGNPLPSNQFDERCDYDTANLCLLSSREMLLSHRRYFTPGKTRCIHVTDSIWPCHEDIQKNPYASGGHGTSCLKPYAKNYD